VNIKALLKRSFVYKIYYRERIRVRYSVWTEQDKRLLHFYSEFIPPGSLCFDVGANVGNRTKIFLKLSAIVVVVEPQNAAIDILRLRFGSNPHCILINAALGSHEHEATINVSSIDTISSMNPDWISSVKETGRFGKVEWLQSQPVTVTTLDRLIARYGSPTFVKIDVEGYEEFVIKGLTSSLPYISIEYTPELTDQSIKCINYICGLGDYELNFSKGETLVFHFKDWLTEVQMIDMLQRLQDDLTNWGDIYFRRLE